MALAGAEGRFAGVADSKTDVSPVPMRTSSGWSWQPAITGLDLRPQPRWAAWLAGLLHSVLDSVFPAGTVGVGQAGSVVGACTSQRLLTG
jgi:hypothetical protein